MLQDMPPEVCAMAKTILIARYEDEVRMGVNEKRTSIQQDMAKLYRKMCQEKKYSVLLWDADEVWKLCTRMGLADNI